MSSGRMSHSLDLRTRGELHMRDSFDHAGFVDNPSNTPSNEYCYSDKCLKEMSLPASPISSSSSLILSPSGFEALLNLDWDLALS